MNKAERLHEVLNHLKSAFIDKEEIIDLLGVCLVARENLFLLGPPGTAKSAIVRGLSDCISDGNNFEYLFTRFTEPNEIFGPFDIRKLKEGELVTNTTGMLPEASLVFLDELFNANSAILNSLLMVLNERIFRRGRESRNIPSLMFVGASNQLPDEEALDALLDRFLVRVICGNVVSTSLEQVAKVGWEREKGTSESPQITSDEVRVLQKASKSVDLNSVRSEYLSVILELRNAGIKVSDRKVVKLQNLIAASATLSGREIAQISDLWVLRYVWDTEDQIEILSGIIDKHLEDISEEKRHPQSEKGQKANPELLAKELDELSAKWDDENTNVEENVQLKDKLRLIQTRVDWLEDIDKRSFLKEKIDALWQHMLTTA
jgi:MoxR-like ATPase